MVKVPVDCVPEMALVPLQVPDVGLAVAVHDVAPVLLQVKVLLPPVVKLVGFADKVAVMVGVGVGVTPGGVVPHRLLGEFLNDV